MFTSVDFVVSVKIAMLLNFYVYILYLLHSSLDVLSLCLVSVLPSDESENTNCCVTRM